MPHIPKTVEALVRIGANVTISKETRFPPEILESIVRMADGTGSHVTIHGDGHIPQTLENLARIGRNNLTIVV